MFISYTIHTREIQFLTVRLCVYIWYIYMYVYMCVYKFNLSAYSIFTAQAMCSFQFHSYHPQSRHFVPIPKPWLPTAASIPPPILSHLANSHIKSFARFRILAYIIYLYTLYKHTQNTHIRVQLCDASSFYIFSSLGQRSLLPRRAAPPPTLPTVRVSLCMDVCVCRVSVIYIIILQYSYRLQNNMLSARVYCMYVHARIYDYIRYTLHSLPLWYYGH